MDTIQKVVDPIPVEIVPSPSIIRPALEYRAVQNPFKEKMIPIPTATCPVEPIALRLAPALLHIDEELVRSLHVRRIGRNLNAEQLVVQFNELVPDGVSLGGFDIGFDS